MSHHTLQGRTEDEVQWTRRRRFCLHLFISRGAPLSSSVKQIIHDTITKPLRLSVNSVTSC